MPIAEPITVAKKMGLVGQAKCHHPNTEWRGEEWFQKESQGGMIWTLGKPKQCFLASSGLFLLQITESNLPSFSKRES